LNADHPGVLVGEDRAPLPIEYLLHALATCITGGIANIAAARGVTLTDVQSTIEGDIDLLGIFGMTSSLKDTSDKTRNVVGGGKRERKECNMCLKKVVEIWPSEGSMFRHLDGTRKDQEKEEAV
jgi:hypothetical protein